MFPVKRFCPIEGSRLTKIVFQNRHVGFRQTLEIGNGDMLVHHMGARAETAEFEDGAIGLNEAGVRCAA